MQNILLKLKICKKLSNYILILSLKCNNHSLTIKKYKNHDNDIISDFGNIKIFKFQYYLFI